MDTSEPIATIKITFDEMSPEFIAFFNLFYVFVLSTCIYISLQIIDRIAFHINQLYIVTTDYNYNYRNFNGNLDRN